MAKLNYKGALKFLDEHYTGSVLPLWVKALSTMALEKQISKKPKHNHHCPTCGTALPMPNFTHVWCACCYKPNFCNFCGQAIDWSEE